MLLSIIVIMFNELMVSFQLNNNILTYNLLIILLTILLVVWSTEKTSQLTIGIRRSRGWSILKLSNFSSETFQSCTISFLSYETFQSCTICFGKISRVVTWGRLCSPNWALSQLHLTDSIEQISTVRNIECIRTIWAIKQIK